ncbi:MAG: cytochrome P450 [candidate division KSB1 bacterium]|nr:cytochrome P450 [candidate division KSB1 bacterium]MDZ7303604.1 cytochrome P450 [candidate division KSB1 bacterium]MDZ7312841.1 cytochrome P450 [candidate division KSB1 bacterium]
MAKRMQIFSIFLLALFILCNLNCSGDKKNGKAPFATRWIVKTSFKYDLCCFVGILTGRELYKKYYGDLQAEWSRKLPAPVSAAIKKIDAIVGPNQPPGPRLCVLLSAVAGDDSLAAIMQAMTDDAAVRRQLMASDFASTKNWQQWQMLKPFVRIVFEYLQKEQFELYWHKNLYPKINGKLPGIQKELQSYDVIGDLKRFLVDWQAGDSLEVYALWLLQPHAIRLTGQRYLTDANYPMHVTVKSAHHELLHPYCERMVDSVLTTQFASLQADPFLQQKLAQSDPGLGYRNFMKYCSEEVVLAADLWVSERRRVISQLMGASGNDSEAVVRKYFENYEGGVHVLAAVIYSYLEAGLKSEGMSYTMFIRELFTSGRLQPGKIEPEYLNFYRTAEKTM